MKAREHIIPHRLPDHGPGSRLCSHHLIKWPIPKETPIRYHAASLVERLPEGDRRRGEDTAGFLLLP